MFINVICTVSFVIVATIVTVVLANNLAGTNDCKCVSLHDCEATKGLEKPLRPSTVQLLREKQCGFQDRQPKICCPQVLTTDTVHSKSSSDRQCKLHNCTVLRDCTSYMSVISTLEKPLSAPLVSYLRSQQCGFYKGFPKVCCSDLPKNIKSVKSSRPQNNRRFNRLNVLDPSETTEVPNYKRTTHRGTTAEATTTRATEAPKSTTRMPVKGSKKKGLDDASMTSAFFDYVGSFDLFMRQKRYQPDTLLDIEIR
nr:unnamed protein product [Callosobruchus chinensis]